MHKIKVHNKKKETVYEFQDKGKVDVWISGGKKDLFQRKKLEERSYFHSIYETFIF